jgi:hypothetical protein
MKKYEWICNKCKHKEYCVEDNRLAYLSYKIITECNKFIRKEGGK